MTEQRPRGRVMSARMAALAGALSVLAALPYLAAGVGSSFIRLDDHHYVTANHQVLQGLTVAGARWALTTLHFVSWHPLTWLSHMLDVTLFGLDARGHHATSILLHALNAGLLFLALYRMTGATARSAFVAAVFGVHPLRVESVAWVSGRKDVLSGVFFMLVLLAWERYARRGGVGRYAAALALFVLGLAAKPILVTLPFVLLLLDVWPLGRVPLTRVHDRVSVGWVAVLLEKVPFIALSALSSAVTMAAHQAEQRPVISLGVSLASAVVSYKDYFLTTLWPVRLAVYYPFPASPIPWPEIAASALLLVLLLLAALRRVADQPFLAVGWCWFVGMLVPVIGLVAIGPFPRADRYTYLPQIGIFLGAAWLAAEGLHPGLRRWQVLGPLAAAMVAAFVAASIVQGGYWRDSETLFRRTLAITKDNWAIENGLGTALAESGHHEQALVHYREAIRIRSDFTTARGNLCRSLDALGQYEEAITQYLEVIRIVPDDAEVRYNLGTTLAKSGRLEEAVLQFREAIGIDPEFADAHSNLGSTIAALGQYEEAAASFREALRIVPDHAEARAGLSWLARRRGTR